MDRNRKEIENAHGHKERTQSRQAVPAKVVERPAVQRINDGKTQCVHFPNCKFGDRCAFAHGTTLAVPGPMTNIARSETPSAKPKGKGKGKSKSQKGSRGNSPTARSPTSRSPSPVPSLRPVRSDAEKKSMPCFAMVRSGSCGKENCP